MKHPLATLLAGTLLFAAVPYSQATVFTFRVNLLGANEVPPTGSPGTGTANVGLDTGAQTLHVQVTFSGLTSPTTASHIHCCLPSPFASGVNVGVATTTPTFAGFPLGVTSGTFDSTLDLTLAGSYNPAFVTAEGGTVAGAEAALIAGLLAGETYLNIHTVQFPGGEIRGFLGLVPEPATWLLMGLGLVAAGVTRRYRLSERNA